MAEREPFDSSDVGRLRRLEVLDELLSALTGVLSLRDVFDRVSAIAQKVLAHDAMAILIPTDDPGHAKVYALRGFGEQPIPIDTRIRGSELLNEQWDYRIVDDITLDSAYTGTMSEKIGMRSALLLPIRLEGTRLDALVSFVARDIAHFTRDDVLIGRRITSHLALALSHERLAEQHQRRAKLQEREANLDLLDGLLNALTGVLSLKDVFDRVSDIAQKVLSHDGMLVLIPTEDPSVATVYAFRGFGDEPLLTTTRIREPHLLTQQWDFRTIDDLPNHPIYHDTHAAKAGMQSNLVLPVRLEGRLQALLTFLSREKAHFTRDDVPIGRRIAAHIALALSHERLAAEQHRSDELQARAANIDLLDEVIAGLTGVGRAARRLGAHLFRRAEGPVARRPGAVRRCCRIGVSGIVYASKSPPGIVPFSERVQVPPALIKNPDWEYDLIDDLQSRPDQKHLEATERGYRVGAARADSARRRVRRRAGVPVADAIARTAWPTCPSRAASRDRIALSLARERRTALTKRADEAAARVVAPRVARARAHRRARRAHRLPARGRRVGGVARRC